MNDTLPKPKRGKTWDPDRDSKLKIPGDRELRDQLERELRQISRDTGAPRVAVLEAERRAAERPPIPILIEDLPKKSKAVRTSANKPDPVKPPKPVKEKRPTVPDSYKTITQLCSEWGVLPFHARQALRGSGLEKPAFGWAFSPKEIPNIKKLVMKVAKR